MVNFVSGIIIYLLDITKKKFITESHKLRYNCVYKTLTVQFTNTIKTKAIIIKRQTIQ